MMTLKYYWLALFSLFFFTSHSSANDNTSKDIIALAEHSQWQALLHINTHNHDDTPLSYIDDESFFLADDGATNPQSELIATISALKNQQTTQCKYPARARFLTLHVPGLAEKISPTHCEEYQVWRKQLNTSSVVLVFASAQLNSPSSMYGHTFLRFDPKDVEKNSTYLSYALNFGATVPEGDDGFAYAARGLTGGYPGNFAANPYFEKIKEYSQLENRDLWEYTLNFTLDEIDTMLAHIWELQGINFNYYFFDENCSYRLLELLDVARPGINLTKQFPVTAMPLDTVRVVEEADIISETFYRPSILTELEAQLVLLSSQERILTLALAKDINVLTEQQFLQLSVEKQQLVVDSAYRYLRYQNTFNGRKADITKRSFLLLKHLNQNPLSIDVPIITPTRPDFGHKTAMVASSVGQNDKQNFLELKYRGSYHDLLDPLAGYYSGMSLNMVNAIVRVYEDDKVKLEKAELLDIVSLSTRNEFFSPWSWQANVSVEQQWTDGKEVLVTQGNAGRGVSYQPLNNSHLFAMATARLEFNRKLDHFASIAPGLQLGFLYYWPKTSLLLEAHYYQFLFDQTERTRLSYQQSLQLSNNSSLRLFANFHQVESSLHEVKQFNEFKVEYRHYF